VKDYRQRLYQEETYRSKVFLELEKYFPLLLEFHRLEEQYRKALNENADLRAGMVEKNEEIDRISK